MTDIERWLNSFGFEISGSSQVEGLFANGYNLGLLMCKLGIGDLTEDVFHSTFKDSTEDMAVTRNFHICKEYLQSISIKLKANQIKKLREEAVGFAPAFLYELKTYYMREQHRQSSERNIGRWSDTKLKSPTDNSRFFKTVASLKSTKNLNDRSNLFLQRFENQMMDIQSEAAADAKAEQLQKLRMRNKVYTGTRKRLQENIDLSDKINQIGTQNWTNNIKLKRRHEFVELQWELTKQKDKQNRKNRFRAAREHELKTEIEGFEKILRAHSTKSPIKGLKTVQDEMDDTAERAVERPPDDKNDAESFELAQVKEHMDKLRKRLPTAQALNEAATAQLKKIKDKAEKQAAERKRAAQEAAQKSPTAEEEPAHKQEASKIDEELFKAAVLRNKEEAEVYDRLWRARQCGRIMKANRLAQLDRIKRAREDEYEATMQEDRKTYQKLRDEENTVVSEKVEKAREAKAKQEEQDKANNLRYCGHLVDELLDLVFKCGEWLDVSDDALIPPKIWRDWTQQMWEGMEVHNLKDLNVGDETPNVLELEEAFLPILEDPSTNCVDVVNDVEFWDFVNLRGKWSETSVSNGERTISEESENFKKYVDELMKISAGAPVPPKPIIPAHKLGFVFTGPRFSGKTSLAMEIARRHAVLILQPSELLKEAVTSVELFEKSEDAEKVETPQIEIGRRVKEHLDNDDGQPVTDELYVELLVEAINREKENTEFNGWIIDGFPSTLEQAKLLEAKLSGFGVEVPAKGKGKKQKSKKKEPAEEAVDPNSPPKSGLDSVFRFDFKPEKRVEILMERARAMRVDPDTKQIYHLEWYPPPDDEEIQGRLVVIPEDQVEKMVQDSVEKFEQSADGLQKWWQQFRLNRELDCTLDIDLLVDEIEKEIKVVLAKKEEEIKAKLLSEAEATSPPAENKPDDGDIQEDEVQEQESEQQVEEDEMEPVFLTDRRKCKNLHKQWSSIMSNYEYNSKQLLVSIRKERRRRTGYICFLRRSFTTWLKRPNDAMKFVNSFLIDYNKIHPDLRKAEYIKDELTQRIEELKEALWSCTLQRKDEAINKLQYMRSSSWEHAESQVIVTIASRVLRAEMLRHLQTLDFIKIYFAHVRNLPVEDVKMDLEGYEVKAMIESPKADPLEQLERMKLYPKNVNITCFKWDDDPQVSTWSEILRKAEDVIFRRRVERVYVFMKSWIEEIKVKLINTFQDLDDLIAEWVKGENMAIDSMVTKVKHKIEEESILIELRLTGSNCFINEGLIAQPLPDPIKEPVLPTPSRDAVFSPQQLLSLATAFKDSIPSGMEKLDSVVEFFTKLQGVVYDNELSALPKLWNNLTVQQLRVVLGQFVVAQESVDWRRLMVNLILEHVTFVSGTSGIPSLETILFMKNALKKLSREEPREPSQKEVSASEEVEMEVDPEKEDVEVLEEATESKPDEVDENEAKSEQEEEKESENAELEEQKESENAELIKELTMLSSLLGEKHFGEVIAWYTKCLPLKERSVVSKALYVSLAYGTIEQLLLQLCFTDAEYVSLEKAFCVVTANSSRTSGSIEEITKIFSHYSLYNVEEVRKELMAITDGSGSVTIDQIMKSDIAGLIDECLGSRVYDCLKVAE